MAAPVRPFDHSNCDTVYCLPCGEHFDHCDTVYDEGRDQRVCEDCADGTLAAHDAWAWRSYAYR